MEKMGGLENEKIKYTTWRMEREMRNQRRLVKADKKVKRRQGKAQRRETIQ